MRYGPAVCDQAQPRTDLVLSFHISAISRSYGGSSHVPGHLQVALVATLVTAVIDGWGT